MRYFDSLPNTLTIDYSGNAVVVKNILTKAVLPVSVLYNPLVFYRYDVQDHDTPESIANKYYGDSYRFWLVLLPNQIIDPQWDWPMSQSLFSDYLNDKYSTVAAANNQSVIEYTNSTIYSYIKEVSTTDVISQNTTTTLYTIDANAYANTTVNTITDKSGFVTQSVTKYAQNIFDYETGLNEAKRSIYLIKSNYASTIESQFQKLMSV